jgi:NTF2-related export protein 1/2
VLLKILNSIEIATRAADHFTRLYYSAYDSPTRVEDLPNFYRANSAVSWNGNPYEGTQGVRDLIAKMPKTQHEVLSFDCHPIPGRPHHNGSALLLGHLTPPRRQSATVSSDYCLRKCDTRRGS